MDRSIGHEPKKGLRAAWEPCRVRGKRRGVVRPAKPVPMTDACGTTRAERRLVLWTTRGREKKYERGRSRCEAGGQEKALRARGRPRAALRHGPHEGTPPAPVEGAPPGAFLGRDRPLQARRVAQGAGGQPGERPGRPLRQGPRLPGSRPAVGIPRTQNPSRNVCRNAWETVRL